ncbi:DNA-directed RNA polymerase III subunit RPC1 [Golovinomyces cichoracearum]|uniref:DNA-directed RNA polymerase n=1 Tax=Golovinomyces cichoracearum TaxID=62708 RepID=A0A420IPH0_9PEZI|nr:DNA-directed RNA polymerase III subunit RPC1 [Golovinomyces cichoracearum]
MQLMSTGGSEPVKGSVVDNLPKKFKELKFGIQSTQHMVSQAVLEVSDRTLYDVENMRKPIKNGALDPLMKGTSSKTGLCDTCGEGLQNCNGKNYAT